ncbi:RepB family protein [Lactococcus lactis]|uniref:RepB family protein n=3 Tax=Lactococcus TaxID=1357 RepID=UPI0022E6C9E6|nr:RepB family protein [Lactococcus lactis]MDA2907975.1 RepB family protein [Lactococcus lactis]
MQKNVYPLYDELKELRGLNGVKDHLSYVSSKQEASTQKIKNKIVLEDNSVSLIRQYFKNEMQQRLALQDKKLLEEYKSEINDLKALKMPSQDTKEEQANSQPQEELETLKEQIRALNDKIKGQEELNNQSSKKWYQFWK